MGNKILNSKISAILLGLTFLLLNISLSSIYSFELSLGTAIGILISVSALLLVVINKYQTSTSGKFSLLFIFAFVAQILSSLGFSLINLIIFLICLLILIFQLISGIFKKRK